MTSIKSVGTYHLSFNTQSPKNIASGLQKLNLMNWDSKKAETKQKPRDQQTKTEGVNNVLINTSSASQNSNFCHWNSMQTCGVPWHCCLHINIISINQSLFFTNWTQTSTTSHCQQHLDQLQFCASSTGTHWVPHAAPIHLLTSSTKGCSYRQNSESKLQPLKQHMKMLYSVI